MSAEPDAKSLEVMFHHVFLPPRGMPGDDELQPQLVRGMVEVFRDSISCFIQAEPTFVGSIGPALGMVDRFLKTMPVSDRGMPHATFLCDLIPTQVNGM